jgi:hypothetical protein
MSVYAPEVEKTFFVYGGTAGPEDRYLLAMASYYDHKRHRVPRPTNVRDPFGINDPHDDPRLTIDEAGHVWVFLGGRGRSRPGQISRSKEPYSAESFEELISREEPFPGEPEVRPLDRKCPAHSYLSGGSRIASGFCRRTR